MGADMDLGIKGRVAIVTGGSRGIGRATPRRLREEGVRVTICARTKEELERARDELEAQTGSQVLAVAADTSVQADIQRLVRETADRFGGVDILVNNAGQMDSGRFEALTDGGPPPNLPHSLPSGFAEDGVLVNAVCPGWVDTGMWRRNAPGLAAELGARSEEEARRLAARKNALGRFGRPEELAAAMVLLCAHRAH